MSKLNQIFIIIISLLLTTSHLSFAENQGDKNIVQDNKPNDYYYSQFREIFEIIENDYMNTPDKQQMVDEAINGMLKSLDPYSEYYTDEDLEFFVTNTDGEFGGIGVEITYDNGAIKVITPIDDLPAYKAGIESGDYIVGIEGQLVSNLGFSKAVKEMRGKPGSKLSLLVIKQGDNSTKEIELQRELVKIKPVKYELINEDNQSIAYIRIVAFNNQTSSELKKAVAKIQDDLSKDKKQIDGFILDLRNNPGGILDQSIAVSEYFIDQGTIVSIKGRNNKNATVMSAGRFVKKAPNVPLVVLINSGSASAAEIVAGALQDHKRGIIVGTNSFGKGLVQSFSRVSKRGGIKLTTAKYYTPSGKSINGTGIIPDIYIENAKVEYSQKEEQNKIFTSDSIKSYLKKYNNEETLTNPSDNDNKTQCLSDKYKGDYQYARAYDLIRGLIITKNRISTK